MSFIILKTHAQTNPKGPAILQRMDTQRAEVLTTERLASIGKTMRSYIARQIRDAFQQPGHVTDLLQNHCRDGLSTLLPVMIPHIKSMLQVNIALL